MGTSTLNALIIDSLIGQDIAKSLQNIPLDVLDDFREWIMTCKPGQGLSIPDPTVPAEIVNTMIEVREYFSQVDDRS